MAEYGLVEPFDCDDLAFCLGVEWEKFRQRLEGGKEFTIQIHRDNAERLTKMCARHNRFCECRPCPIVDGFPADHFDEWRQIMVGGFYLWS